MKKADQLLELTDRAIKAFIIKCGKCGNEAYYDEGLSVHDKFELAENVYESGWRWQRIVGSGWFVLCPSCVKRVKEGVIT